MNSAKLPNDDGKQWIRDFIARHDANEIARARELAARHGYVLVKNTEQSKDAVPRQYIEEEIKRLDAIYPPLAIAMDTAVSLRRILKRHDEGRVEQPEGTPPNIERINPQCEGLSTAYRDAEQALGPNPNGAQLDDDDMLFCGGCRQRFRPECPRCGA